MLLSVDVGLRGCGAGRFFKDGALDRAAYVRNPSTAKRGADVWTPMVEEILRFTRPCQASITTVVVEVMHWTKRRPVDPNDLLELNAIAGGILASFPAAKRVSHKPDEWKGTVNADVMTARIQERLTQGELARVELCPAYLMHNLWDGVGIGLHHFGRLAPHRVLPR